MKKQKTMINVLLLIVLSLSGCAEQKNENSVAGKLYTYTGESFSELEGDPFTITIGEDGTYSYCESKLSSYIGNGRWSVNDDELILTDDTGVEPQIINYFLIEGDDLVFIEDNSSNFIYIKVKDGERFHGTPISENK